MNYERTLRKMKRLIKEYVIENSALADKVAQVQKEIDTCSSEREILLNKLYEYEPAARELSTSEPKIYKKTVRKNSDSEPSSSLTKPLIIKKKSTTPVVIKKQPIPQPTNRLPTILTSDGITLYSHGRIVTDRPAYHTESVIYPVGYKISRVYNGSNYVCRILDNGNLPLFEIYRETNPKIKFMGSSTDDVHSELLQALDTTSIIMPDGDRFFGLKNKGIMDTLTNQPAAKKLAKFNKVKKFENFFFDDNARFMSSSVPDHLF